MYGNIFLHFHHVHRGLKRVYLESVWIYGIKTRVYAMSVCCIWKLKAQIPRSQVISNQDEKRTKQRDREGEIVTGMEKGIRRVLSGNATIAGHPQLFFSHLFMAHAPNNNLQLRLNWSIYMFVFTCIQEDYFYIKFSNQISIRLVSRKLSF